MRSGSLATIKALVPSGKGQEEAALLGDAFLLEDLALIAARLCRLPKQELFVAQVLKNFKL
ncbi:hypothetical protein HMPREF0671_10035 [Prevotella sp. S7 MS 2]|nr:hypothetical protein HMPREF0671_10035 [Prevotella sp. S7 MS 2]